MKMNSFSFVFGHWDIYLLFWTICSNLLLISYWLIGVLYIFSIWVLCQTCVLWISSPMWVFHYVLTIFSFMIVTFYDLFYKAFPIAKSQICSLFSSKSFIGLTFMLKSIIYLELIFSYGMKKRLKFIFFLNVCPAPFVTNTISLQLCLPIDLNILCWIFFQIFIQDCHWTLSSLWKQEQFLTLASLP